MKAKVLNGTEIQNRIFEEIKYEIQNLDEREKCLPGIAFVAYTGHQPLMKYTILLHERAARELGFNVIVETISHNAHEEDLISVVEGLNNRTDIHAIVLLQPVPKHINALNIIERIDRNKEVEGFHPRNVIDTQTKGLFQTEYPMCLPVSLMELFHHFDIKTGEGKNWIFVSDQDFISDKFRSLILRTSAAQVVPEGCASYFVNSENKRLEHYCKQADFLFVISERPEFLNPDWIKRDACIIDIYSNLVNEVPGKKNPEVMIPIIRGGVNTQACMEIAGAIAPCPGGLMPVLLAVLFRNALHAFKIQEQMSIEYH